jgi:uncharacterized DUF497 family protein
MDEWITEAGIPFSWDRAKANRNAAKHGVTLSWRLLAVTYTWRAEAIRIISARPVTAKERRQYENP